ncbi:MAG: hypothetical protein Q9195_007092 [Heterodermia aff. obscurata]
MAIINPVALGGWLYMQCMEFGVEIRLNEKATSVDLNKTDEALSLGVIDGKGNALNLQCNHLVLAAGPWSPALFNQLFPKSSVKIEAVISAGEWFVFENPESFTEKSIAGVYFNDIVGQKLEFAGRNDNTIWTTGEKSEVGEVPSLGDIPKPDPSKLAKLRAYADMFLKHPHTDGGQQGLRVLRHGRSYRPATWNSLPVIAGIPSCSLNTKESGHAGARVFINSGHGSYGVTLSMGSGKLMSQMILNKRLDVDISKLGPSYK